MRDTLTDTQTPANGVAMAPASTTAAGAAPVATPATPASGKTTPPAPRKGSEGWPAEEAEGVLTAPAVTTSDPATVATPPATAPDTRARQWIVRGLGALVLLGTPVIGGIGFAASYDTLKNLAAANGFGGIAPWFPIGIDVGILIFLAWDLIMVARRRPWPLVRVIAHVLTLATVGLNAAAGRAAGEGVWDALWGDPTRAVMHGLMPILFIVGVEGARRLLIDIARLEDGGGTDSIPVHRWILSPIATPRLYRRMRLANITSYEEMVRRMQELEGYRVWLKQELKGDLSKATDEQRLPMTMFDQGYTVQEALALPAKWKAEADEREAAEDARKAKAEAAEAERNAMKEISKLESDARIKQAKARIEAVTRTAEASSEAEAAEAVSAAEAAKTKAEFARRSAVRQAEAEEAALESEEAAAARRRAAEDDRAAAEAEAAAEEARLQAARKAEEAERRETAAEKARADRAEAARLAAVAGRDAALAEQQAAEARAAAARADLAATAADDLLKLTSAERNVRRVARWLLAAHPAGTPVDKIDIKAVPLSRIMDKLNLGQTRAGELRQEALALLEDGYTPDAEETYAS
ncbi:DUF2637 domain-containing protein [Streptomyces sp. NPDC006339]|uniref:DUF2637 domain-containing protein n=1 Tax=Streptomyces sp. NPDC006339 TaxID=3156755 RepID=UPI0033AE11FA